jgi:hypothetical protein
MRDGRHSTRLWKILAFLLLFGAITSSVGAQASGGQAAEDTPSLARHGAFLPPFSEGYVTEALVSRGFVNVATVVEGNRVFVTFENTRYRDSRRGLDEVAAQLLPAVAAEGELVLVPSADGVPLGTATYISSVPGQAAGRADLLRTGPSVSLDLTGVPKNVFSSPRASSSFGRADVVVHPWLEARLGQRASTGSRVGVGPELRVPLRQGTTLHLQVLLTLHDGLSTGESRIRPGLVLLRQRFRLPHRTFASFSGGSFVPDRYGFVAETQHYSRGGRWSFGMMGAATGKASYGAQDWYYEVPTQTTLVGNAAFRDLEHGISVRASGGVFAGAPAVRLDVRRQFGETDWGFFGVLGETGMNAGFNVRIPLFMTEYARPGPVRLRPAEAARWEYFYHDRPTSAPGFRIGDSIDDLFRWLQSHPVQ